MKRVKYFATYHGPSYGLGYGYDLDRVDAFYSKSEVRAAMHERQKYEADTVVSYVCQPDGFYRKQEEEFVRFPATTREDFMDVYAALWDAEEEGYEMSSEPEFRVYVGDRGGIKVEAF